MGRERPAAAGAASDDGVTGPVAHGLFQKWARDVKKLIESTLVSLDGIVDGQEKWTAGYFDEEAKAHAYESLAEVDIYLLGRGTYEKFSSTWPNIRGDRYFDRINNLKKLVVSSVLDPAGNWNATAICRCAASLAFCNPLQLARADANPAAGRQ